MARSSGSRAFRGLALVFVLSFINLIGVVITATALGGVLRGRGASSSASTAYSRSHPDSRMRRAPAEQQREAQKYA